MGALAVGRPSASSPLKIFPRKDRNPLSIDAALLDAFNLPRGYWGAKDERDSLEAEMKKKFDSGYPRSNILFQRPTEALLFQDGRIAFHGSIKEPAELVRVLHNVFGIQVGVGINVFVRRDVPAEKRVCKIFHARTDEFRTRGRKEEYLSEMKNAAGVKWQPIIPDPTHNWIVGQSEDGFAGLLEIANPEVKRGDKLVS